MFWLVPPDTALDRVHNAAVTGGHGLVEFHNHLGPPAFSPTDEDGLAPMADYATDLMPDRPYGAGVYAAGRVHVEYWCRSAGGVRRGRFRSVTVLGDNLRLLNAPRAEAMNVWPVRPPSWGMGQRHPRQPARGRRRRGGTGRTRPRARLPRCR